MSKESEDLGPVQWGPPVNRMTDKHDWKHYLPITSLMNNESNNNKRRRKVSSRTKTLVPLTVGCLTLCSVCSRMFGYEGNNNSNDDHSLSPERNVNKKNVLLLFVWLFLFQYPVQLITNNLVIM